MASIHELTDVDEIKFLYDIAKSTGHQDKITCENPASKSGQVAELIMMQADTLNPAIAARWRSRVGVTPTIAAMAAKHGHAEMTPAARASLQSCSEDFVLKDLEQQEKDAKQMDAKYQQGFEQLRMNRFLEKAGGNEARAKHLMQQEDAVHARQQAEQQALKPTFGRTN